MVLAGHRTRSSQPMLFIETDGGSLESLRSFISAFLAGDGRNESRDFSVCQPGYLSLNFSPSPITEHVTTTYFDFDLQCLYYLFSMVTVLRVSSYSLPCHLPSWDLKLEIPGIEPRALPLSWQLLCLWGKQPD